MLTAAEAGIEVSSDAPVMTEAVGPLVTAVDAKTWPPVVIYRQMRERNSHKRALGGQPIK
jgi:hypothetical protein